MSNFPDPNYDPGFPNYPGKGQGPTNPLSPLFVKSLGIIDDLSVYRNIFSSGTINSKVGFTLGLSNFFGSDGFQVQPSGTFKDDITLEKDIVVGGSIIMNGRSFRPKVISTESGSHLVLAAY